MWDIKPGDLVVFIGWPPQYHYPPALRHLENSFQRGDIFTVMDVGPSRRSRTIILLFLEERPNYGFVKDAFRPIPKPSIESLRGLLVPTPELADA